jgi:hypothetical protein
MYIDKTYKQYNRLSRYNNFPYYYSTLDNKYIYGTTAYLRTDTPYVLHTVERDDTLDSIALKYYNNPTYFWIIADFNRIRDPYKKLEIGQNLKVPSFSAIRFES